MNNNKQNGIEYKVYETDDCLICPDQKKCATESKRKIKDRCESEINEIKKNLLLRMVSKNLFWKRFQCRRQLWNIIRIKKLQKNKNQRNKKSKRRINPIHNHTQH